MEICVARVTVTSVSYTETISTAQPSLCHRVCINHSVMFDVIQLYNSECFLSYGIDNLWLINHTRGIHLLCFTQSLYLMEHILGVFRCLVPRWHFFFYPVSTYKVALG